jgi:hypothetical protein
MDDSQEQSADRPKPAQVWDIPDASTEFSRRVRVDRWNQQAWPPLTFGVPEGWSDVLADQFALLPAERRIPPDAPVLQDTTIVAALQRPSDRGQPWHVQLRLFARQAMGSYVLDDPVRWSQGRSLLGELTGKPRLLRICGCPGVLLTYSCHLDGEDLIFAEAWWSHPSAAYYFVASAPTADADAWLRDFDTMLEDMQEQGGYPSAIPPAATPPAQQQDASLGPAQPPGAVPEQVVRYRCNVQTYLPFTLENVTSGQRRLVVLGSPSVVAWSMVGVAAMAMHGRAKARRLQGREVSIPASGEVTLTGDGLGLHVMTGSQAGGVQLRAGGSSWVDLQIPYRLVRRWGQEAHGIWLEIVGRGPIWLQTSADQELAGWIAHLSQGRTWQPPTPIDLPRPPAIGGWCQQDPRFTFAFPQGWDYFPRDALADFARSFTPDLLRCGVGLNAGEWEVQALVIDCGPASAHLSQTDPESLAALLIEGLSPPGVVSLVRLDGDPAVLARAAKPTAEGVFDRTYGAVVHDGALFALWYGTVGGTRGDGSHERWLPDFHSMLATWHWY